MTTNQDFDTEGRIFHLTQRTTSKGVETVVSLTPSKKAEIGIITYSGSTGLRTGDYISAQGNETTAGSGESLIGHARLIARLRNSRDNRVLELYERNV